MSEFRAMRYKYNWTRKDTRFEWVIRDGPATERLQTEEDAFRYQYETSRKRADAQRKSIKINAKLQEDLTRNRIGLTKNLANIRAATNVGLARSRESTTRSGLLARANASNAAASLRATEGSSQSSKLLTEFEAQRQFQRAQRRRESDSAQGQLLAGFGASGIQASSARGDVGAASRLAAASDESAANQRRQQILNQGRTAITGAISSSVQSGGELAAGMIGSYGREMNAITQSQADIAQAQANVRSQAEISTLQSKSAKEQEKNVVNPERRQSKIIPNFVSQDVSGQFDYVTIYA